MSGGDISPIIGGEPRIKAVFDALKAADEPGLITFITAGDPDPATSAKLLAGLAEAGADVIELGMPFTDPMADGKSIQAANLRSLAAGTGLKDVLAMVAAFRRTDTKTPVILMGYYNPVYIYGVDKFLTDAKAAGVDGLIVVDLPPEEDAELCLPTLKTGLSFIRLATPTTDDRRLPAVLRHTSGFVYYVSVAGVTGANSAQSQTVAAALARLKNHTDLPVAVGFGIRTPDQAAAIGKIADAAVVGSAIIDKIADSLSADNRATEATLRDPLKLVAGLKQGLRNARKSA